MDNKKTKEISRNKIYEYALQLLVSFLSSDKNGSSINFEESIEDILDLNYEDCPIFLKELLILSLKHEEEAINYLSKYLKSWNFNRLNVCIQADLIISYVYYFYTENPIKGVILDVAIDLAKKYGDLDDYKFVNAILDNCLVDDSAK